MSTSEAAWKATTYPCEQCDYVAQAPQGLSSHMRSAHNQGAKSGAKPAQPADLDLDMLREIDDAVAAATQAISTRLAGIEREIVESERRIKQLRSTRKYLASRLRAIKPDALPDSKPGPKKPGEHVRGTTKDPERIAAVEIAIRATNNEFLATDIYRQLVEERANGGPKISVDAVRKLIRDMHERGEIRLVRVSKGGGQVYATIGVNGDGA